MSNATYCARYRDKRHQEFLALRKSVDRLIAENQNLRKTVDRLLTENQELKKSVDRSLVSVDRSVDREIEEKQKVKKPRAPARVEDESLSKSSMEVRKKPLSRSSTSPEFDAFWAIWPHKVCKTKAFESHAKALTRVTQAELLDGVRRYVASKPDSQNWCHPTTWLNQDRWTDQPAPPVRQRSNGGGSNYSGLFS